MKFAKGLELLILIVSAMFHVIDAKEEKRQEQEQKQVQENEYQCISIGLMILYAIYLVTDMSVEEGIVFPVLTWTRNHPVAVFLYLIIAAIAPSIAARIERKREKFTADEKYASANCRYNLLGVLSAGTAFLLACFVIKDFNGLIGFYVEDIALEIAPLCVSMVLIYQKAEWNKDKAGELDHSASLKHMNQKLNLLHLFNMYFLAIVSVIYIVAYTIYCQMYHMDIAMNALYFVMLTLILVFFYRLSQHKHRYLYLTSVILIPVILVSGMYWMTWMVCDSQIRGWQLVFIAGHTLVYMLLIFRKENVLVIGKRNGKKDADSREKECPAAGDENEKTLGGNRFLYVLPMVVVMMYVIVWNLPSAIERLPASEAHNYIDMICAGTDMDADTVIEKAMAQSMYNEADGTYDVGGFMRYISEALGTYMWEKGIIQNEGDVPLRHDLNTRCVTEPRYR